MNDNHTHQQNRGTTGGLSGWAQRYQPLFVTIAVSIVVAGAINVRVQEHSFMELMHNSMGVFFCILALFKLFDLKGFQEGFAMYDLIAKRMPAYGYAYPFIELVLGGLYIVRFLPTLTYVLTVIIMGIGLVGVMGALFRGLDTKCACMGTFLNVPLSTVSVFENLGMAVMALIMLTA